MSLVNLSGITLSKILSSPALKILCSTPIRALGIELHRPSTMQRLGRELSGEKSIRGWPISSGASVDIQDFSPMPTISPGSCESSFLRAKFQGNTPEYCLSQCATSLQLGSKVFLTRARWATVSALTARVQRCPTVSDMTVLQV